MSSDQPRQEHIVVAGASQDYVPETVTQMMEEETTPGDNRSDVECMHIFPCSRISANC
jgi:hypothetical protein